MLHLHRHVQYAHPQETPTCSSCSRRFAARSSLVRHQYTCKEKEKKTGLPLPVPVHPDPADQVQDELEDGVRASGSQVPSGNTVPAPGGEGEERQQ